MEISKNQNYFKISLNKEELKELETDKNKTPIVNIHIDARENQIVMTRSLYSFVRAAILVSHSLSIKDVYQFDNLKISKHSTPFI